MRHYLKGSSVPRTLHPWPGWKEEKEEGRRAPQGLPRLYLLSSKKIHFFLFLFFAGWLVELVSDVSGFQATGRLSSTRNKEGKQEGT